MMHSINWTENEINFLIENYSTTDLSELSKSVKKSKSAIAHKACRLNLKRSNYVKWSKLELDTLISKYPSYNKADLLHLLPNRSWEKIVTKAVSLGVKRNSAGMDKMKSDISPLFHDTNTSAYWIGFLLADGHFSKKHKLELTLNVGDMLHLDKFRHFISHTGIVRKYKKSVGISIMNSHSVPKLKSKFDICSRKTYNPPNLEVFMKMSNEYLTSLIIGFIDGDGHISVSKRRMFRGIRVKCHASWMPVLNSFLDHLNHIFEIDMPFGQIDKRGYAKINITRVSVFYQLREFAALHGLPVLSRKWNQIEN